MECRSLPEGTQKQHTRSPETVRSQDRFVFREAGSEAVDGTGPAVDDMRHKVLKLYKCIYVVGSMCIYIYTHTTG